MAVTYEKCPLCHSSRLAEYVRAKDYLVTAGEFSIQKCASCGFVFTQNIPGEDEIGGYYQSQDYISHSDTKKGLMNRLYHLGRSFMLGQKYRIVRKADKGKKLLDIGTGTGYFPGYLKKKGYDVAGVEIEPNAREFAKKEFGVTVFSPDEFLEGKVRGPFDVITLWHVLEHLHDFNNYLEKIKESLRPSGALLIALPNCSSFDARYYKEFWAGYDVPRHLWHFTPSTMKMLAENHGFDIVKMRKLPLDPFYNSMLSEKYKKNGLFMVSGMLIGLWAYAISLFKMGKSSSIVYILCHRAQRGRSSV